MQRLREAFEKRFSEEGSLLAVVCPPKTYPWLLLVFIGVMVVGSNWGDAPRARADEPAPLQQTAARSDHALPEAAPAADGSATPVMKTLTQQDQAYLVGHDWEARTDGAPAVWVSVDEQMLRLVRGSEVLFEAPCATAEKGTGQQMHSNKTPLGWHTISKRIGEDAPWGQVFRSKTPTNEIWKPGQASKDDLVLTRILVLDGLEEGHNKGGNVDSFARYIYVHGTNGEDRIGTPSSHGCIRLRNDDVIALFDLTPEGTRLLITERSS
jgi:hypothetical protein